MESVRTRGFLAPPATRPHCKLADDLPNSAPWRVQSQPSHTARQLHKTCTTDGVWLQEEDLCNIGILILPMGGWAPHKAGPMLLRGVGIRGGGTGQP